MPEICTALANPTGCGHYNITINGRLYHLHESDINQPLTDDEIDQFYLLAMRWKGVAMAQLLNRVIHGDEATNVKAYSLFGPGAVITLTNMRGAGANNYTNVCPGTNGEHQILDFTGCTEYRLRVHANFVGTGPFGIRILRTSDNAVLAESTGVTSGEKEIESDWQPLPAPFVNSGVQSLRMQVRSATASDDPVFRSLVVGLR